jgi:hypothetical protein
MRANSRPAGWVLTVVFGCALAACGGGSGDSSTGNDTTKSTGSSGGGNPPPPPGILLWQVMGAVGIPLAWTVQGQGYDTVSMETVAQEGTVGVPLVSIETTALDSTGKQVAPTTTTSLTNVMANSSGIVSFNSTVQLPIATPGIFTLEGWVTDSNGSKSSIASASIQVVASSSLATVVTATGPNPRSLTLNNGVIYWVESDEYALRSAPTSGGAAQVLATRMLNPSSVVFSGSNVVWLDDRDGTVAPCSATSVTRVLKETASSGFTSVLAGGATCSGGASQLELIGTTVYWVSSTASPSTWMINATSLSGGATTTVHTTSTPVVSLAANAGTLYWMENPYPGSGTATIFALTGGATTPVASGFTADASTFAVDSSAVYYAAPNLPATSPPTETLWAQPLAGGSARALSTAISTPVKVVSTLNQGGSVVVWMDETTVNSVPAAGGAVTQLATITGTPLDLLDDGTSVDWTSLTNVAQYGESGTISSVPLGGGAVSTVYQGGDGPRELALDPQSRLNWTEGGPVGITEGFARIARIGSGGPETVVDGINSTTAELSATSTALLVADQWRVKSLALTGGPLTTLVVQGAGLIGGITNDGTSVYWDDGSGAVSKEPLGGGPITVLVSAALLGSLGGPGGPIVLSPDGASLYWADNEFAANFIQNPTHILTTSSTVPATQVDSITQDAINMTTSLAVNSTTVYVADPQISALFAIGPTSLNIFATTGALNTPTMLALDSSDLYWTDGFEGQQIAIFKGAITQNATNQKQTGLIPTSLPLILESTTQGDIDALALDSNYVYFADAQLIRKTPK